MSNILILGYYGFKNSGDDALLLSIIREIKSTNDNAEITVLSNNAPETKRIYNVNAIDRADVVSILIAMKKCDVFVLGGGTLIQDGTSTKSLLYYLAMIKMALLFRNKVMLFSNGIGPLSQKNVKLTARILNKVDVITLRDKDSLELLDNIGVDKVKKILTADCAFCIENNSTEDVKKELGIDGKYICVSVRDFSKLSKTFCQDIAKVCDYIFEKYGIYTCFMPFQKKFDNKISAKIQGLMKNKSYSFDTDCNIERILSLIKSSEMLIGMRLHSLIYASISNVPQVGLIYDPKISGFMQYIGQKNLLDVESLSYDELKKMVDYTIQNQVELKKELENNTQKMKKLAKENAKILNDLLDK